MNTQEVKRQALVFELVLMIIGGAYDKPILFIPLLTTLAYFEGQRLESEDRAPRDDAP